MSLVNIKKEIDSKNKEKRQIKKEIKNKTEDKRAILDIIKLNQKLSELDR